MARNFLSGKVDQRPFHYNPKSGHSLPNPGNCRSQGPNDPKKVRTSRCMWKAFLPEPVCEITFAAPEETHILSIPRIHPIAAQLLIGWQVCTEPRFRECDWYARRPVSPSPAESSAPGFRERTENADLQFFAQAGGAIFFRLFCTEGGSEDFPASWRVVECRLSDSLLFKRGASLRRRAPRRPGIWRRRPGIWRRRPEPALWHHRPERYRNTSPSPRRHPSSSLTCRTASI